MTGLGLLQTALLLGLYVLLAGGYGLAYTVARLKDSAALRRVAWLLYGLHGLVALAVVTATPLAAVWKALILASSIIFFTIPPITWRYLQRTHRGERFAHDRKHPHHVGRIVARL